MLDTTRRVATPEGIELTLRLAGPVPRALAWAIDFALRAAAVFAVMMVALPLAHAGMGLALIAAFFAEWLLPAWFEARGPAALIRNLLRAVDFLPLMYGIGLATLLANGDFKRLSDLAAGTVVVYQSEKSGLKRNFPDAQPIAPPFHLDLEEQRAVLELAERSASLTRERLEELAELPGPLVGRLDGPRAAAHLIGMANYLLGRK